MIAEFYAVLNLRLTDFYGSMVVDDLFGYYLQAEVSKTGCHGNIDLVRPTRFLDDIRNKRASQVGTTPEDQNTLQVGQFN